MIDLTAFFMIVFGGALSWSIFGMSKVWWKQKLSALCLMLFVVATLFAGINLLGKPKPVNFSLDNIKGEILAYSAIENKAIWLWIIEEDSAGEPAYYSIPWSEEDAKRLREAFEGMGQGGTIELDIYPRSNEDFFPDYNNLYIKQFSPPPKD